MEGRGAETREVGPQQIGNRLREDVAAERLAAQVVEADVVVLRELEVAGVRCDRGQPSELAAEEVERELGGRVAQRLLQRDAQAGFRRGDAHVEHDLTREARRVLRQRRRRRRRDRPGLAEQAEHGVAQGLGQRVGFPRKHERVGRERNAQFTNRVFELEPAGNPRVRVQGRGGDSSGHVGHEIEGDRGRVTWSDELDVLRRLANERRAADVACEQVEADEVGR